MYLLNKNIAQLRGFCGENTSDLRPTLSNLSGLLSTCSNSVVGEVEVQTTSSNTSPARFQLPMAPPVLAGVARQGVAMVTVNSPARRVSMGERDESSSGSDDKVIEGDIKLELGTNGGGGGGGGGSSRYVLGFCCEQNPGAGHAKLLQNPPWATL